jgi:hypothetical protein
METTRKTGEEITGMKNKKKGILCNKKRKFTYMYFRFSSVDSAAI